MNQSPQFASLVFHPHLRRILALAFLLNPGWVAATHAQSSTSDTAHAGPASLPDDPPPAPAASTANAAPTVLDSATLRVGRDESRLRTRRFSGDEGEDAPQWSRSMLDPFEPGPNFGNFAGSPGGGNGLNGTRTYTGRQGTVGFNRFGGTGMGGDGNGRTGPLFLYGGGANGYFGSASLALPSLNQLMRGSDNLHLNNSSSNFRLSYQDALEPGGSFSDLGRTSASAMFTSSDLGNGVFLSAGTTYGSRMAGAPAATIGNGSAGGPKHPGPGVALKLSF